MRIERGNAAHFTGRSRIGSTEGMGILPCHTPDGRCVSLLKILLTNACIYDCAYCINRLSSNARARFSVDEVVQPTLTLRAHYIEGLFSAQASSKARITQWLSSSKSLDAYEPNTNSGVTFI